MMEGRKTWYEPVSGVKSLGSQGPRPGSLAGLHQVRRENLAQFFTPEPLARFVWEIVRPAIDRAIQEGNGAKVALLDNSVGSGRLFQFADPEKHYLAGIDVHKESIAALIESAESAGFECDFQSAGMEDLQARNFGVGIINPPFSIHLESPNLKSYPCTTWGKFGPNTSAMSHAYALYQALDACEIVAAILPSGFAEKLENDPGISGRLRAIFSLPPGSFSEEGTAVAVSVAIFDHRKCKEAPARVKVQDIDFLPPDLRLSCSFIRWYRPGIRVAGTDDSRPSITLPVTGDRRVRIGHSGRKIGLSFRCGLTQAKVLNAMYRDAVQKTNGTDLHRYPKGVEFEGQGVLDLEVHLMQPNPVESFRQFAASIEVAGGLPDVDPGLWNYLRKRARQVLRQSTPFAHDVFVPGNTPGEREPVTGKALKTHLADPGVWGSAVVRAGQECLFTPEEGGGYGYEVKGKPYRISREDLSERFEVCRGATRSGWTTVYPGKSAAFPRLANQYRERAKKLGVDRFLSWDFQFADLTELFVSPKGSIVAWDMGLGKARLAAGIVLLSGTRHGLVVVEPHLIPEMRRELSGLPISSLDWHVIEAEEDLSDLRKINVISYNRLRALVDGSKSKRITYARRLRHRIGVLVADEGHLLRNQDTLQSGALWSVGARRRFVLSGTPVASYSRDILPLLAFTAGDGTAAQPYGLRRGYLEPRFRTSMSFACRGVEKFKDDFLCLEWVTREFDEDLRSGAKREIPRIKNLQRFRETIAPHLKRRLASEPMVTKHFRIPTPEKQVTTIDWDPAHLAYYLEISEEFAQWFRSEAEAAGKACRNVNLVALLARIQAVQLAANYPQGGVRGRMFAGLTSKQEFLLDRLEQYSRDGHKTILYARWPALLELFARHLDKRGIETVVLHGKRPIDERTEDLDRRFRFGNAPVLLASLGVTQTGLNIHQADRVIFAERDWSHKTEEQAAARTLRPQQDKTVLIEFCHLLGSVDEYMAQMVEMKASSAHAGIDWSTPDRSEEEFLHMDTILGRFCEDLRVKLGCDHLGLRKTLVAVGS